jgi:hypothetical protein
MNNLPFMILAGARSGWNTAVMMEAMKVSTPVKEQRLERSPSWHTDSRPLESDPTQGDGSIGEL